MKNFQQYTSMFFYIQIFLCQNLWYFDNSSPTRNFIFSIPNTIIKTVYMRLIRPFIFIISLLIVALTSSFTLSVSDSIRHHTSDKLYTLYFPGNQKPQILGFATIGYLGNHQWLMYGHAVHSDSIYTFVPYSYQLKYHPNTLDWAERQGDYYKLRVQSVYRNQEDFIRSVEHPDIHLNSFQPLSYAGIFYVLIKDENALNLLAQNQSIIFISPYASDEALNQDATAITDARFAQQTPLLGGAGLSGRGILVGIGDDGINDHGDVDSRIRFKFNPMLGSGHSIHVGVTALGGGIVDERYKGFAPGADLLSQYFSAVVFYGPTLYEDFGMSITNNSYGSFQGNCDYFGTYNEISAFLDEISISHPKLLHIFAAGNDGSKICSPYGGGFGTVLGGYQPSKNTISVGNMGKGFSWLHANSSKGPVRDGRLKPEISAIGRLVMSGGFNDSYFLNTGTSMATPNVTGAVALLSEYYLNTKGELPDNVLLKIALLNGTQDIHHEGPDYRTGYGMLNLKGALDILQNERYQQFEVEEGDVYTYEINVPEGLARLKVMICWNDPPAIPSADQSLSRLVNNLNLSLQSPTGEIIHPWVLNPSSPDDPAVRGIDTLNNSEQVSITNPVPGAYLIKVQGARIAGKQMAYLAWNFESDELRLLSPLGGEKLLNTDSIRVYYTNANGSSTYSCFFSTDNGVSWSLIKGDIPSSVREFAFLPGVLVNSAHCKVLIIENSTGKSDTSAAFVVSGRLNATLAPMAEQCPGSATITWTGVDYADQYVVYQEINGVMQAVDTVASTQTNYTFTGLSSDKKYWFSVAPLLGDQTGIRAVAVSRIPNNGQCTLPTHPEKDLALVAVVAPRNGRQYTSTELLPNEKVKLQIQNRSKTTVNEATLGYIFDDESPVIETFTLTLAPGRDTIVIFSTALTGTDAPGEHNLILFHQTSAEQELRHNDTLFHSFAQLSNEPITYLESIVESFETLEDYKLLQPRLGIPGTHRWDYDKTNGYGRLQTFVNSDASIQGARSITLDLYKHPNTAVDSISSNKLIATYNLAEVDFASQELRFDFQYRFAGKPKFQEGNQVFVRGTDTDTWIEVAQLDTTFAGTLKTLPAISLNDVLASAGQTFSSSTQVMIMQRDTSLISGVDFGNGLTVDSVRLYPVSNDVSVEEIVYPLQASCSLTASERVRIRVRNNVYYPLSNVEVNYRLNGGEVRTAIIPWIPAKTSQVYTFSVTENFSVKGVYTLDAWVKADGDSYADNDSILHYEIFHLNHVANLPYLQTFEEATTDFLTGDSSSFVMGVPTHAGIRYSANGDNCWSADGILSDSAKYTSYLYSPCFDLSGLDNVYLSFSLSGNFPMEDTHVALAAAWVEYSTDDGIWHKLGSNGSGHNWYNHPEDYWAYGFHHWKGVTHLIPEVSSPIRFRWVFRSFSGSRTSNMAIDDIHIYQDNGKNIWSERGTKTESFELYGTSNIVVSQDDYVLAEFDNPERSGTYQLSLYNHSEPIISASNEMIIPTSFAIKGEESNSAQIQLYVPHSSIEITEQNECNGCQKPHHIYRKGISIYQSNNSQEINAALDDNKDGAFRFIHPKDVYYLPYRDGYIVSFRGELPGEYWFNSGGVSGNDDIGFMPVEFTAIQTNSVFALLQWVSKADSIMYEYYLERLNEHGEYQTIHQQLVDPSVNGKYQYRDEPPLIDNTATYRLRYLDAFGITRYTKAITLLWTDMGTFAIFPNPVTESNLNIAYKLTERAPIQISLFEMSGKKVFDQSVEPASEQGIITLSTGDITLSASVYVIRISSGEQTLTEKVVFLK